jgi:hypothetical protein
MNYFKNTKKDLTELQDLILKHYDKELTLTELHKRICKEHPINISNISKRLKKLNLPLREGRGSLSKLTFNPFEIGNVDNEYWLGFLLADGHIAKTPRGGIFLYNTEMDFLRLFHIHCKVKLGEQTRSTVSGKNILIIFFGDKITWNYLSFLGFMSDKRHGFDMKFNLTFPILRGIFDGDGYCRVRKNSLEWKITTGSIELVGKLQEFLKNNGFKSSVSKKGNAWDVYLKGTTQEKSKFLTLLYEDGNFHLKYKFDKLSAFISEDIRENRIKCWEALRDELTTTYPEMESVNV